MEGAHNVVLPNGHLVPLIRVWEMEHAARGATLLLETARDGFIYLFMTYTGRTVCPNAER